MAKRKIDPRRIKTARNYSIDEAAARLGVHKNTVKQWLKSGLPCIREGRPVLILGQVLKDFLVERRQKARKPCPAGQLFCLKCREPRRPAERMLDYVPITPKTGNLKGICEACGTFIYRRILMAKIEVIFPACDVAFPQCQQRLTESA